MARKWREKKVAGWRSWLSPQARDASLSRSMVTFFVGAIFPPGTAVRRRRRRPVEPSGRKMTSPRLREGVERAFQPGAQVDDGLVPKENPSRLDVGERIANVTRARRAVVGGERNPREV